MTIVVSDPETGLVGQVPVACDLLPAAVQAAIGDGLDVALRAEAAKVLGVAAWHDVPIEQARAALASS